MKKILSLLITLVMLISAVPVSAATYTDIAGHWATKQIEAWSNYGVISGYDGKFSPNRSITRGEFAVVLNRLMAYQKTGANTFSDLPEKFYTDSILKLNKAGVMQGYDGKISPEASLTREEASVMICRTLGISQAESMTRSFADESSISSWAKPYVNALVNAKLLNGADGKLNPKNTITRAEVVTILDNAVVPVLKTGETKGLEVSKILVISTGNATIKNFKINGKVIVTQGVKDGMLKFTGSEVNGDMLIDNDRSAFIAVEDTTFKNKEILKHKAFVTDSAQGGESSGGDGGSSGGGASGGGNSGGGDSGNSNPAINYKEINAEMIKNLKVVSKDVGRQLDDPNTDFNVNDELYILKVVKECIDETITYEEVLEITPEFIKTTHYDEIMDVQGVYDSIKAKGEASVNSFHSKLFINLNSTSIFWLAETLGIDLSEYGFDSSDYL